MKEERKEVHQEIKEKRQEVKTNIQERKGEVKSEVKEMRDKIETVRKEMKERREVLRTEIKEKREAFKEKAKDRIDALKKKVGEERAKRIEQFFSGMMRKFEAAIDRLDEFADRIESRLNKMTDNGKDVTALKDKLTKARKKLPRQKSLWRMLRLILRE